MKRRMLSILLALAFLVAGVPAADVAVTEAEAAQALPDTDAAGPVSEVRSINFNSAEIKYAGDIGNVRWGIDSSGVFAFYYSDATPNKAITNTSGFPAYTSATDVPWYRYRSEIRYVTMANLDSYIVTGSMDYYFANCQNLEYVIMLPAVANSMRNTFYNCEKLQAVGCLMPDVSNMNYCFMKCPSLRGDLVFASNPASCLKAFSSTDCEVLVVPDIYDTDSKLALEIGVGRYSKLGNFALTLYGISRVDGSLLANYNSDCCVPAIRYGQRISDAQAGSTGGLRLAYKRYGESFRKSIYVPCLVTCVKKTSAAWNTVLDTGTYPDYLDIRMSPTAQSVFGTVQPSSFYSAPYKSLSVERCPVSECKFDISGGSFTYDGTQKMPAVTLTNPYNGAALVKGADYTVSYKNNVHAGTATVSVAGQGRYSGTTSKTFTIAGADMSDRVAAAGYKGTYDGLRHGISVTAPTGAVIQYGTEREKCNLSSSPSFVAAGTYTVFYEVKASDYQTYKGSAVVDISKKNISSCTIQDVGTGIYNGKAHTPSVTVYDRGTVLGKDTDYTITYSNNINAGTATITVNGKGNYSGSAVKTFSIMKTNMSVSASGYSGTYDQTAHGIGLNISNPANGSGAVVRYGTSSGTYNLSSSPTYKNAGSYTVYYQVTAPNYNAYTGSARVAIAKKNISDCTVRDITSAEIYDGRAHTPPVAVYDGRVCLTKETDYSVSYSSNVNAGTASVIVTGKGNYCGSVTKTFSIANAAMTVRALGYSGEYDQEGHGISVHVSKPSSGAAVTYGTKKGDYCLRESPVFADAGTYTVYYRVTAPNYNVYTGNAEVCIREKEISACSIAAIADERYDGKEHTPDPAVADGSKILVKDRDYTLSYSNCIDTGMANVTVTGKGNYCGSKTSSFSIQPLELQNICADSDGFISAGSVVYTGEVQNPDISMILGDHSIPLKEGTDYVVESNTDIEAGFGTISISGKGNYAGQVSISYIISAASMTGLEENMVFEQEVVYTGSEVYPDIQVHDRKGKLLADGKDYDLIFSGAINVGTAKVKAVFRGNYTGSISKSFYIKPAVISDIVLSENEFVYNGKEHRPTAVGYRPGDYEVSYRENVNAGKALAIFSFYGNYTGTVTKEFMIGPRKVLPPYTLECLAEGDLLRDAKLSWNEEDGEFFWCDPNLKVCSEVQKYDLYYKPGDNRNYDWTKIGEWDGQKELCRLKCEVIVIANPVATCVKSGDKLGASVLSSNQKGAVYEWENPDIVVEGSSDAVNDYRAVYHYRGKSLVRMVRVPVQKEPDTGSSARPVETQKPDKPTERPAEEPQDTAGLEETPKPQGTEGPQKPTRRPAATQKPFETERPEDALVQGIVDVQTSEDVSGLSGIDQSSAYEWIHTYYSSKIQRDMNRAMTGIQSVKIDQVNTVAHKDKIKVKWLVKRKTKLRLKRGKRIRLMVKGVSKKKKLKWHSTRKKVVSVNKSGVVRARRNGVSKVMARVGKKKYVCKIVVKGAAGLRKAN